MARQALKPALTPRPADRVRFCSRCGTLSEFDDNGRVCGTCGMGMLLTAPAGAIEGPDDPFLVVSDELKVVAVSSAAEKLFGAEATLLSSSLLSTLSGSDGDDALARAVRRAALGAREVVTVPVKGASAQARRAGRLEARIAPCGPPRAALVVIELALRAI
jgi:hypothetical protein